MSMLTLLAKLKNSAINIKLEDNHLKINAPKGKLTPDLVDELKEHKEEIIQFLQQVQTQVEYVSITPVEKKEYYPLSSAQKRLYFLQQFEYKSTFYNMPYIIHWREKLNPEKLEEIFKRLISRHKSLRTSFRLVGEEPVQRITEPIDIEFAVEHYQEETEIRLMMKDFVRPFDLSQAPLLRVGLVTRTQRPAILLVDMHHIISDGASEDILAGDFLKSFRGIPLPPLRIQYNDYAEWQNSRQQQELIKHQQAYWKNLFADELPVLNLPLDFPRPAMQSFEGNTLHFAMDEQETKNVKQLAQEMAATLYMTVLCLLNILLHKLSNQEDIIVGTPVAGRLHPDLENIMGMFVNTLPMRSAPVGSKTIKNFLKEVKTQTLKAYENQFYQFDQLVEQLSVRRDTSRNPIFDVMCNFLEQGELPQGTIVVDEQDPAEFTYRNPTAKFDLILTAMDRGEQMVFELEYCTRLFKEPTVRKMIEYFKKIARGLPPERDMSIADLEIISREEKTRLLTGFNDTEARFPLDKTIHRLFEEQVDRTPQRLASIFEDRQVTYMELNKRSNRLAGFLRARGVKPDVIVGMMIERSIELIPGNLAILKAGGAYLPIEDEFPTERKLYMFKDSSVRLLLTNDYNQDPHRFADMLGKAPGLEIIDVKDENIYSGGPGNLPHINRPQDLMYLIYTSGSTGQPKGVMLEHRNLVNLMIFCIEKTNLDFSAVLQFSTISFDASIHEIFTTLLCGGKLCLIHKDIRTNLVKLFKVIEKNQLKTVFMPISLLKVIFNEGDYAELFPACVDHIQTAGDQVLVSDRFRSYLQKKNKWLHNHYGPAETHVATVFTMPPDHNIAELPPIGKPVANTVIYILDRYEKLQPIGVAGELFIGGIQVGRGYCGKVQETAQKFIPSPFKKQDRLYRTGDLSKWQPDGNIQFLGRIDFQVKIRGFRIEPGEIETQILNHGNVQEAVVLPREDANGEKYLCAYVVAAGPNGKELDIAGLKASLQKKLADYMIPAYFVRLDRIPLNPSGKVDRKALPEPGINLGEEYVPPQNDLQKKLVEIWAEVLGLKKEIIGIDSNFFQVGGQSLKATVMAAKVHKTLNVILPLQYLFRHPTIRGLAEKIKTLTEEKYAAIVPTEKKEYYPLSSAQKRLHIIQQLDENNAGYNMSTIVSIAGELPGGQLEETFEKLIHRHQCLRSSFEIIDNEPVQRVHHQVAFEIEYYDLDKAKVKVKQDRSSRFEGTRGLAPLSDAPLSDPPLSIESTAHGGPNPKSHELRAKSYISSFIRPFDLARGPLLRVGVIRQHPRHHTSPNDILMVDMHHIITDGVSQEILVKEFIEIQKGRELPPLRLEYKDYLEWQDQPGIKEAFKQQENYWLKEFAGKIPGANMPLDFPRPAQLDAQGNSIRFDLGKEETARLQELAKKQDATLFMVLMAIYNVLLAKLCRQEDIVVGTGVAGRRHDDLLQIIGMFVNTLAVRNYPQKEKTFKKFLAEVKQKILLAFENQDYPFDDLVEKLIPHRNWNRNPLFDTAFVLQNLAAKPPDSNENEPPRLSFTPYDYSSKASMFDLSLFCQEQGKYLGFTFEYAAKLYKRETIERLITYFKEIAAQVVENSDIKLKDIAISHGLITAKTGQPEMELGI